MPETHSFEQIALENGIDAENLPAFCAAVINAKNEITTDFLDVALANAALFDRKQSDYGPDNISKGGLPGVILRSSDKLERLMNLYKPVFQGTGPVNEAKNESIRDNLVDLSNYGIIGVLLKDGVWHGRK